MSELLDVQPPPVNEAEDNPAVWESVQACRLRVPAPVEPWAPYHPHDRLTSLRNEVVGIVVELAKLRGQVPVQRYVAHAGSPEVVP